MYISLVWDDISVLILSTTVVVCIGSDKMCILFDTLSWVWKHNVVIWVWVEYAFAKIIPLYIVK